MINQTDISNTIDNLDNLYNTNPANSNYYSKLAILELCGWIELTMDEIIEDYSKKLICSDNISFVKDKIINKTYGFNYDKHFRPMLMNLLGIINLEQIEIDLKTSGDLITLTATLDTLHKVRCQVAHTHISGITMSYDAPSKIKSYLTTLFSILKQIYSKIMGI